MNKGAHEQQPAVAAGNGSALSAVQLYGSAGARGLAARVPPPPPPPHSSPPPSEAERLTTLNLKLHQGEQMTLDELRTIQVATATGA